MKVLFLYPVGTIQPKRSSHVMGQGIMKQLLKRGHEIYSVPASTEEKNTFTCYKTKIIEAEKPNRYARLIQKLLFNKKILAKSRIKEICDQVKENKIEVILERHSLAGEGFLISKLTGVPYVTNDVIIYPDLKYYGNAISKIQYYLLSSSFYKQLETAHFQHATAIISHSTAYSKILQKEYDIPEQKIFQFYAMVDKEVFTPHDKIHSRNELNLNHETFYVTYIGSFDALHTPELLIPVIKKLSNKNIGFILIGDGPSMGKIKQSVLDMNKSSQVIMPGRITQNNVINYIRASDVCVESIWNNRVRKFGADSIKIYEYMACAKPVIASNLPGQIQEIKNKRAGFLINPSNTEEFYDCIMKIYNDPLLGTNMGIEGRRIIQEKWDWDYTGEVIDKALSFAAETGRNS